MKNPGFRLPGADEMIGPGSWADFVDGAAHRDFISCSIRKRQIDGRPRRVGRRVMRILIRQAPEFEDTPGQSCVDFGRVLLQGLRGIHAVEAYPLNCRLLTKFPPDHEGLHCQGTPGIEQFEPPARMPVCQFSLRLFQGQKHSLPQSPGARLAIGRAKGLIRMRLEAGKLPGWNG